MDIKYTGHYTALAVGPASDNPCCGSITMVFIFHPPKAVQSLLYSGCRYERHKASISVLRRQSNLTLPRPVIFIPDLSELL
jgi:hypothetical protein